MDKIIATFPHKVLCGIDLLKLSGNSVKDISDFAFMDCTSLSQITFPSSVRVIAQDAFHGCTNLQSVTLHEGLECIFAGAFTGCGLQSLEIPSSVTSISGHAFTDCTSLTSVTLPAGITNIGNLSFEGCTALTDVTLQATTPTSPGTHYVEGEWVMNDPFPTRASITLHVPAGTEEAYRAHEYWGTFKSATRGDVNGDGQVTIADVTALVNIILGKSTEPANGVADVNGDGSVTIADVTKLVNIILGKD